jgi:periplasmic divalent cation tolerance protein
MKQVIQIQWTCANVDEARDIVSHLLVQKLIACATIIPHVESHFIWEGNSTIEDEVKVVLKTTQDKFELVRNYIDENCEYDTPEISYIKFDGGNEAYFEWVDANVLQ